jgi:hypothetical protein
MNQFFNAARRLFLATSLGAIVVGGVFIFSNTAANAKNKKLPKPENARLGINFSGLADWNAELPFVDLMRMSGDWVSLNAAGEWGKGPTLTLDENGWVTALQKGSRAIKVICSLPAGQYPSGDYTILYDGEGELSASNGKLIKQATGKLLLKIDGKKDGLMLEIVKTNPQNYLRNIRVLLPGFAAASNPWQPSFLQRWQGIACIRLMDYMQTNNSTQNQWAARPKPSDASFANKGVPVELMVDLANRLNTDVWFCMPHLADDDYVKQFAQAVKDTLNPKLRAWVEYSNEVWNGGFSQHQYAAKQGQRLGLAAADKAWQGAWHFYAQRSVQIFNIWQNVFVESLKENSRFVRVLASQAAYTDSAQHILSFQNAAHHADVLAIAPYVTFNVPQQAEDGLIDTVVANWGLDKLFAHINSVALPETMQWIKNNKKLANDYGLALVGYESGQHLVGVGGAENNDKLTQLFMAANADARMGDVYAKSFSMWQQLGGDLTCAFNSVGGWSKWGSWGLQQQYNHKPTAKFKASIEWAISRGQNMRL